MRIQPLLLSGILSAAALALPAVSAANEIGTRRTFGLGLVLGYPDVGLSINYFLSPGTSLQIDPYLSYHSGFQTRSGRTEGSGVVGGRFDVLFWPSRLATGSVAELKWFIGPGGRLGIGLGSNDGFFLAAEVPIGLGVQFQRVPFDINVELIPILGVIHSGGVDIGIDFAAALNARYYF